MVRTEIYLKLADLYVVANQTDKGIETIQDALKSNKKSVPLRLKLSSLYLECEEIDEEVAVHNIQEQVEECPKLMTNEEFEQLLKKYGLKAEGHQIVYIGDKEE